MGILKKINYILWQLTGIHILAYFDKDKQFKEFYKKINLNKETTLRINESYQIYSCVKAVKKLNGSIVEAGVFKGGSAKLIAQFKKDKKLYLLDTFQGLPKGSKFDNKFNKGQFRNSLKNVQNYLREYPQITYIEGLIPDSFSKLPKLETYSFVNLDLDLYEGTYTSLQYFYSRMNRGGIILSHDYSYALGVKKAFNEFFRDKPETVIELSGSHVMVVKL